MRMTALLRRFASRKRQARPATASSL